ncbi:hypothetical protein NUW58_g5571 [Xylaria curta]|uniref:Uncharacterized protein n=1 Tax=Xylaria curta TaxID=42375 RepID=A0ACC1P3G0_9PEZI|nr:hypothetical protein NUW58_g5571 [Xylaria curta]
MAHTQGNFLALQLLASVAQEAHEILFPLAIQSASGPAANIAIQLMFIAKDVPEQELSRIPLGAQTLSTKALQDLLKIAKWPPSPISWGRRYIEQDPQELWRTLGHLFHNEESKHRVQQSVTQFCRERPHVIQPFESRFTQLSGLLMKNTPGLQRTFTDAAAYSLPPPRIKAKSKDTQESQQGDEDTPEFSIIRSEDACEYLENPTYARISIGKCEFFLFMNILMALERLYHQAQTVPGRQSCYWFYYYEHLAFDALKTRKYDDEHSLVIFVPIALVEESEEMGLLALCFALDEDYRLHQLLDPEELQYVISCHGLPLSELLKLGDLTVEHKIKLWTSEDILLFRLDQEFSCPEDIPFRVFVSFPFGGQYREPPAEYYDMGPRTHRYPRILYLGIILLEIGLGQALRMGNFLDFGNVEHANRVHMKAKTKLRELKKATWDGFASKDCFVEAVENCLESFNFKETTKSRTSRHQSESSVKPHLSDRRDALYRKVVAPLFRLATVGFEDSNEPPLIRISSQVRSKSLSTNDEELQHSWAEIRSTHSSFLSGPSGSSESFLDHLQVIAGHITRCRRLGKATKPIRVAILDTGYQKALPFFQDDRRCNRLRGWKDFTTTKSQNPIDTFGHGTFMTRLLMHVAPIADIYVIRVAEDTEDLENHEQHIVNAIIHAGLDPEWSADIISMSFGIPHERRKECEAISEAIEKVTAERDGSVLFFAAAGNSGIKKENFPASHKDVISIYATNSDGGFLESNPSQPEDGPKLLGTYGTDIPLSITKEIRMLFPQIDLSAGSSIATAIAAGVAAMILSYVAALPSLLDFKPAEKVCAKLSAKNGMEQMLYVMSVLKGYKHHFINPVGFWGEKEKDMEVFTAVCAAVN